MNYHAEINEIMDEAEGLAFHQAEVAGDEAKSDEVRREVRARMERKLRDIRNCAILAGSGRIEEETAEVLKELATEAIIDMRAFNWQSAERFVKRQREQQTNTGGRGERVRRNEREVRDNDRSLYDYAALFPATATVPEEEYALA